MNKISITATSILLIGLISFFVSVNLQDGDKRESRNNLANLFENDIDKLGQREAYEKFKAEYKKKDITDAHIAAHLFAEVLYKKHGIESLNLCDSAFSFGCYHVLVAKKLTGTGIADHNLEKICDENAFDFLACQHGLGHGLLEYLGEEKITEALELCPTNVNLEPLTGCEYGVFMAYNMRPDSSMDDLIAYRPFEESNPYIPCPTVAEEFKKMCYSQIIMWWDKTLNGDFSKISLLCDKAEYRSTCFAAMGFIGATIKQYDVEKVNSLCLLPLYDDARLLCKSGSYLSFLAFPPKKQYAEAICREYVLNENSRCKKEAVQYLK